MDRRTFLRVAAGAAVACAAPIALAHHYPFEECVLFQSDRITHLARCRWGEHWWWCYEIKPAGSEECIGGCSEEWLVEAGRSIEDELNALAEGR